MGQFNEDVFESDEDDVTQVYSNKDNRQSM